MQCFHKNDPVPEPWLSGTLPKSLLAKAGTSLPQLQAGLDASFPRDSEEHRRIMHALSSAFPELGAPDLLVWMSSLVSMCEAVRERTATGQQGLEMIEFYAGTGAISLACKKNNVACKAFDLDFEPDQKWDLTQGHPTIIPGGLRHVGTHERHSGTQ